MQWTVLFITAVLCASALHAVDSPLHHCSVVCLRPACSGQSSASLQCCVSSPCMQWTVLCITAVLSTSAVQAVDNPLHHCSVACFRSACSGQSSASLQCCVPPLCMQWTVLCITAVLRTSALHAVDSPLHRCSVAYLRRACSGQSSASLQCCVPPPCMQWAILCITVVLRASALHAVDSHLHHCSGACLRPACSASLQCCVPPPCMQLTVLCISAVLRASALHAVDSSLHHCSVACLRPACS